MKHLQLNITGMTCDHCVAGVRNALSQLTGIESAAVAVGSADVRFDEAACTTAQMVKAVEAAGFAVAGFNTLSD